MPAFYFADDLKDDQTFYFVLIVCGVVGALYFLFVLLETMFREKPMRLTFWMEKRREQSRRRKTARRG